MNTGISQRELKLIKLVKILGQSDAAGRICREIVTHYSETENSKKHFNYLSRHITPSKFMLRKALDRLVNNGIMRHEYVKLEAEVDYTGRKKNIVGDFYWFTELYWPILGNPSYRELLMGEEYKVFEISHT